MTPSNPSAAGLPPLPSTTEVMKLVDDLIDLHRNTFTIGDCKGAYTNDQWRARFAIQNALAAIAAQQQKNPDHFDSGVCGGVQVPKYDPRMRFLEKEKGTLDLRIEGLSMRQIKDIFEQEYDALMWSEGCAYPSEKVKLQFIRADFTPAAPTGEGA